MKTKRCDKCGKIIEGFSDKDVEYRMLMHNMTHRKDAKSKEVKEEWLTKQSNNSKDMEKHHT